MLRRLRRLVIVLGVLVALGIGGFFYLLSRVAVPSVTTADETTALLAADGSRLASLTRGENRVPVGLAAVPSVVVRAVLATEDKNYYEHGGVDPLAIGRALVNDLRGKPLQGGSTITQQYVKNVYVGTDRTASRKIKEALIAVKLERSLTKGELLERYLNVVYFGRGAYGVQAAAQAWFGKDVGALGLREAAYLAGLIRAPELADVTRHPEAAERRRHLTLRAMVRNRVITEADVADVEAQPLSAYVVPRGRPVGSAPRAVGVVKGGEFVVDQIRRTLVRDYGEAKTFSGALRVQTTVDLDAQQAAYRAVYDELNRTGDPSGALVAVDDEGRIRALVGGRDFAASSVNLALGTAGGGRGRQPGSTFKPMLLAEIARAGYSLDSTFDAPASITLPKADNGKDWTVRNYENKSYGDDLSLLDATRSSVNTAYAQAEIAIGPAKLAAMARDLGVTAPLRPVASLVLGTIEVSPLDIASAYSTLARRGERMTPRLIESVTQRDGTVLFQAEPTRTRVLTTEQADAVNTLLTEVIERGTGIGARLPGAPDRSLIGKTGTTQNYTDAWFVGASTKLTAAVWVGYPDGKATLARFRGGAPMTGSGVPAGIWKRFMQSVTKGSDLDRFPIVDSFDGTKLTL